MDSTLVSTLHDRLEQSILRMNDVIECLRQEQIRLHAMQQMLNDTIIQRPKRKENAKQRRNLQIAAGAMRGMTSTELANYYDLHPASIRRIIRRTIPRLRQAQQRIDEHTGIRVPNMDISTQDTSLKRLFENDDEQL